MGSLEKEKQKIEHGKHSLETRRQDWNTHAKIIIEKCFKKTVEKSRNIHFPFSLYCVSPTSNINEETIQLMAGINPTGVILNEVKQHENSVENVTTSVLEKGCALAASFSINGTVSFIISPYKSERHSMKEENIFICYGMPPEKITEKSVKKIISSFLFYSRFTSIFGISRKINVIDLFHYYYLLFLDIRNRQKIMTTAFSLVNEWSKILLGGVVGYIVAMLTK